MRFDIWGELEILTQTLPESASWRLLKYWFLDCTRINCITERPVKWLLLVEYYLEYIV